MPCTTRRTFPGLTWQPTDFDADSLASIQAWRGHAGLPNLLPPLRLDAANPDTWPVPRADAIVNINMIHISPWSATEGLMAGAGRVLAPGGVLFLYGPYIEAGWKRRRVTVDFDMDLRRRNPEWGLRDLAVVVDLAGRNGLELSERIAMPANNLALVFQQGVTDRLSSRKNLTAKVAKDAGYRSVLANLASLAVR